MIRRRWTPRYTVLDRLMASPDKPMPPERRTHQLTRMHQGLAALETAAEPAPDDWRVVSDAVNLLETLVGMGHIQDDAGLIRDAIEALATAGARHLQSGQPIRLTGAGIQAVRAILADYAMCLEQLPARVMVEAHRITERRVHAVLEGRARPEDICIMEGN
jgi:uncharacterized protein YyaL (SSP411 family)